MKDLTVTSHELTAVEGKMPIEVRTRKFKINIRENNSSHEFSANCLGNVNNSSHGNEVISVNAILQAS